MKLSEINDIPELFSTFTTSAPRAADDYSNSELALLAERRKALFWIAAASILVGFWPTPRSWWPTIMGGWLVLHVAGVAVCTRTTRMMGQKLAWAVLSAVPLFNYVAYYRLMRLSRNVLRANGIATNLTPRTQARLVGPVVRDKTR